MTHDSLDGEETIPLSVRDSDLNLRNELRYLGTTDLSATIPTRVTDVRKGEGPESPRPKRSGETWASFLRVRDWTSDYSSVQNLLQHLDRKSRSDGSKRVYLWHLYKFCVFSAGLPDELVHIRCNRAEKLVQSYADTLKANSAKYANTAIYALKAFFKSNGFKHSRALDLETYHQPPRVRKTPQCIPSKAEIYRMADSACSLRDRAIILCLFSTGLRNSTLRALVYRDVNAEIDEGRVNIRIPVYPEMKNRIASACKGGIPYFSFTSEEATEALKLYMKERKRRYGGITDEEPLFTSDYNQIPIEQRRLKLLSARELQVIVKLTARRAGLSDWKAVHPHSIRKAFETVSHSQLIDGSNLDPKFQEFFVGHILPGSQDPYFDSTKVDFLRVQYSKLKFGRVVVENKFNVMKLALARAFQDTGIDPDQVMEEYVNMKRTSEESFS